LRKITIEISEDNYQTVISNLHHGQLSAITRLFMENLSKLFIEQKKNIVMDWLYGKDDLTLLSQGDLDDTD